MSSQTVMTVCEEMDGAGNTKNFPQSAKCMHLAEVGEFPDHNRLHLL